MRSNKKITFIVVVVCICFILSYIFVLGYFKNRSTERLSLLIKEVEVGLPLPEVIRKLGKPSRVLTTAEDVEEWGAIKDKKIIENCDLYMFPYLGLPHKYILVYVSKDSNEVYIVREAPM
jgi:hypothetical protein